MRRAFRIATLCATKSRAPPSHGFSTSRPAASQVSKPSLRIQKKPNPHKKTHVNKKKYEVFKGMIFTQFNAVLAKMGEWSEDNLEYRNFGITTEHARSSEIQLFRDAIQRSIEMANQGATLRKDNPLFWSLRNAFIRADVKGLTQEVKYCFQSFMLRKQLAAPSPRQKKLADLRYPMEWFPATRAMQRTIHLHVGPTNSGKTYRALKALESAKTGIYGGPLRLLAHEIYTRFTNKGKPCAMITGEEQRIPEGEDNFFISCTVEMTPLNRLVDVAVLDEIQMIGDKERGWAWTQALLGVMAKEVHLCGEERVVDLIKAICASNGEKCIVHRYQRLSPLEVMKNSLDNDLTKLEKGDAVVAFTRVHLHGLKKAIEDATDRRCAIVYGSLPPETRAQQAALFNDPDNDYDFLVASDAIGMGLNLEIKRVIFETAHKHDGVQFRNLSTSEIKQIGGRAGRYKTARQAATTDASIEEKPTGPERKVGYVTTLDQGDLALVATAFQKDIEPLEIACIHPPAYIIEQFAEYFPPDTPLSYIMLRLREQAPVSERFTVHVPDSALEVADAIQEFPMTIQERLTVLNAPVAMRNPSMAKIIQEIGKIISMRRNGALYDIESINLELLDASPEDFLGQGRKYLLAIETLHQAITLYLWVSYRFPSIFVSQTLAFHIKDFVEEKIAHYLATNTVFRADAHQQLRERQRKQHSDEAAKAQEELVDDMSEDDEDDDEDDEADELDSEDDDDHVSAWDMPPQEVPLVADPAETNQPAEPIEPTSADDDDQVAEWDVPLTEEPLVSDPSELEEIKEKPIAEEKPTTGEPAEKPDAQEKPNEPMAGNQSG